MYGVKPRIIVKKGVKVEKKDKVGKILVIGMVALLIVAFAAMVLAFMNIKTERQKNDLKGLCKAVNTYLDRKHVLPGDTNGDGYFDSDEAVWKDLEDESLAFRSMRSPYGYKYHFGSDTTSTTSSPSAYRKGNFIRVAIPWGKSQEIDKKYDDGVDSTGTITYYSTDKESYIYYHIE